MNGNNLGFYIMSTLTLLSLILLATCIFDTSALSIVLSPSPTVDVVSGQNLSIICQWSSDYTFGGAYVQFRKNNGPGAIGSLFFNFGTGCPQSSSYTIVCDRSARTLTLHVQADNYVHGDTLICEGQNRSSDGMQSDNTTVFVIVPVTSVTIVPSNSVSVDVGSSTSLLCVTQPYSRPTANVTWYKLDNGQRKKIHTNITVSYDVTNSTQRTRSQLIYWPSKEDNGRKLFCTSDGGWSDGVDDIISSTETQLLVSYKPYIVISPDDNPYMVKLGQTGVTLTCGVIDANPSVLSLIWMKNSTVVSNNGIYSLTVIRNTHAGTYTCEATNEVGTTSKQLVLDVKSPPEPPYIIGIAGVSPTSLVLKWRLNTGGGTPNKVIITYYCTGCQNFTIKNSDLMNVDGPTNTTITGLKASTGYTISVTASNDVGSSIPSELYATTSEAPEVISCAQQNGQTGTILIAISGILLCAAIVVFGISFYMYRSGRFHCSCRKVKDKPTVDNKVTFKNVSIEETGNRPIEERGAYDTLDQSDVGKPSVYDSVTPQATGNTNDSGEDTSRRLYENVDQQATGTVSEYEQLP